MWSAYFAKIRIGTGLPDAKLYRLAFPPEEGGDSRARAHDSLGMYERRAITFSIFLRRSAVEGAWFDESLGVGAGSPWGAGEEESGSLLRAIERGHSIYL